MSMDSQSHMIPYSDCGTQLPRPTRHHTETSDLIRHPTCVGFTMQWQDNHRRLNLGRESHTKRREALNLLLLSQLPSPRSIHKRYSVDVSCLPDEIDSPCHYSSQPDKQQFTGADWATTADKRLPPQSSGKTILKKPATRQQAADVSFFPPAEKHHQQQTCTSVVLHVRQYWKCSRRVSPSPNAARPIEHLQQANRSAVCCFCCIE